MNKAKQLAGVCLLTLLPALSVQGQQTQRPDGWYHVREGRADSLDAAPFITLEDIAALELDTDAYGKHVITGKVREDKRKHWTDETAKAIGRRIAFVWQDSVLTAPRVNARIESGHFQISSRNDWELPAVYRLMMETKGPNETDMHRADSLRRVHSQKLWDEARQYKVSMTDTTFLDTRGPMSLKAIDAWSGDGFNENYAFNQTVGLLGRTGAGTKASMRGRRPAGAYLLLGRGPIHQSGIVRLHYGNADPMEPAAGVRRLGDRRAGRCVCRDAEEEVNREPVYTSF